jgi:hypothetical protein
MIYNSSYKAVNMKTPIMIFWLIIALGISTFMFWLFIISDRIWFSIITFIASLYFPFLIYYSITSKIILTTDAIVKKTIFGTRELKYRDIKSVGIYNQMGSIAYIVNENDLHIKEYFAQKFGFVSKKTGHSPNSIRQKGSIKFHIVDDLFEKLKIEIDKASS